MDCNYVVEIWTSEAAMTGLGSDTSQGLVLMIQGIP